MLGAVKLVRTQMFGFTEREYLGFRTDPGPSFLERLETNAVEALSLPDVRPDLRGYVKAALRGGFPRLVLDSDDMMRDAWIGSYLDQLLIRDGHSLVGSRDQFKLARYFEALASNSAGIPGHKMLYDAAGITRVTADVYDALLEKLFVTESVPAWTGNRLDRLTKAPKRYVVELPGGRLIAIEIKASASPTERDARHLRWLRERLPDRFVVGAVLHTGPDVIRIDESILALPICALWG